MPKINRKNQKIFASNATNNGQFGSAELGTKLKTNDVETLQALSAYQEGWASAALGGDKLPTLEEFQALHYITNYQLAYMFQEGIPEYNAQTTYFENSIVKQGSKLYISLTSDNLNNPLTDIVNWRAVQDFLAPQVPIGTINTYGGITSPDGWMICDGTEVSRTTYSNLYSVIGDSFGAGDGSTTFLIPDMRGVFARGLESRATGGRDPDGVRAMGSYQADEFKSHTHTQMGTRRYADGNTLPLLLENFGDVQTKPTGGDETRPKNIALNYIIKY